MSFGGSGELPSQPISLDPLSMSKIDDCPCRVGMKARSFRSCCQ